MRPLPGLRKIRIWIFPAPPNGLGDHNFIWDEGISTVLISRRAFVLSKTDMKNEILFYYYIIIRSQVMFHEK